MAAPAPSTPVATRTSTPVATPKAERTAVPSPGDDEALFALHAPADLLRPDAAVALSPAPGRQASATELLHAMHFLPSAYRGSRWKGVVRLVISRSFSAGVAVDGDSARVLFSAVGASPEPYLTLEGSRETLLSMLEGRETPCMLVVSGALWVSDWRRALLFQEAFDLSADALSAWRAEQRRASDVHVRPSRHSPARVLAGGPEIDADVESAIQTVLRQNGGLADGIADGLAGDGGDGGASARRKPRRKRALWADGDGCPDAARRAEPEPDAPYSFISGLFCCAHR